MTEWISVKERLPTDDYSTHYLVYGIPACGTCEAIKTIQFASYLEDKGFVYGEWNCPIDVSHWMEPKPPKENT